MKVFNKDQEISSWLDWPRPKKAKQWQSGRSAMEVARHWFTASEPQVPMELHRLVDSSANFSGIEFSEAYPEFETKLPEKGEGRNHDLILLGVTKDGAKVLTSVEAKVDEPYDSKSIGQYYRSALRGREKGEKTGVPERIEALLPLVFGPKASVTKKPWGNIRYQLLTALSGTLIEASNRGHSEAILVIHEFLTDRCVEKKITQNENAFRLLMTTLDLIEKEMNVKHEQLYGPIKYPMSDYLTTPVDLYIGKIRTDWGILNLSS